MVSTTGKTPFEGMGSEYPRGAPWFNQVASVLESGSSVAHPQDHNTSAEIGVCALTVLGGGVDPPGLRIRKTNSLSFKTNEGSNSLIGFPSNKSFHCCLTSPMFEASHRSLRTALPTSRDNGNREMECFGFLIPPNAFESSISLSLGASSSRRGPFGCLGPMQACTDGNLPSRAGRGPLVSFPTLFSRSPAFPHEWDSQARSLCLLLIAPRPAQPIGRTSDWLRGAVVALVVKASWRASLLDVVGTWGVSVQAGFLVMGIVFCTELRSPRLWIHPSSHLVWSWWQHPGQGRPSWWRLASVSTQTTIQPSLWR